MTNKDKFLKDGITGNEIFNLAQELGVYLTVNCKASYVFASETTENVTITNSVGLHARPATFFIQKANEFKSSIWIVKEERKVNAKSLLGVLSLGITKGTQIDIVAEGVDEAEAVNALEALIETNFND